MARPTSDVNVDPRVDPRTDLGHSDESRGSFLSPYSALLRLPGAAAFYVAGGLGRYPRATLSLGVVLLVSAESGSYATAGLVASMLVLLLAVSGPAWSAAMDRFGQARVLALSLIALILTSTMLIVVVTVDAPRPLWFLSAALTGASAPDLGSAVRARWRALVDQKRVHTAFALESVADESAFVVAPPVVTLLAASVHPAAGLAVALLLGVVGAVILLVQTRTEPPRAPRRTRKRTLRDVLPPVEVLPVSFAFVAIGGLFGAFDVTAIGWAADVGVPVLGGTLIGILGLSMAIGSTVFGVLRFRISMRRRYLVAAALLGVLSVLLPATQSGMLLLAASFVLGLVVGPMVVAGLALVEHRSPPARATEALAYPSTGLGIGVTAGATLAGAMLDAEGPLQGYLVATAFGLAVVLLAVAGEGIRRWVGAIA
ncbi:MFS transporter [Naasia lichenicola]|uniref:MFS transporter n=1 Tax=Naasia lichenicola TaxID=2565933 RepID=UPI00130E0F6E|nr:MFS transporter [Naasia lichenicola]